MDKILKKEFTPETSDFAPIEASMLVFINKYIQDGKLVDSVKPTIPYWPCSPLQLYEIFEGEVALFKKVEDLLFSLVLDLGSGPYL